MVIVMNLLTAEHLTHSYTEHILFQDAAFHLQENEKVGIIGINGTGKSTLLKILAGIIVPDQGTVKMGRNLKISYLPQNPSFQEKATVLESALSETDKEMNTAPAEAKSMLNRLGISDYDQPVMQLSGGERKRIALVRTLLTNADILVLDEPTNHLDSSMSEWLEHYLQAAKSAVIMITHDRYFLDSIVSRIVEIDKGKLYSYQTNYMGFVQQKAEREEMEAASERKRQSLLRTELEWMMRGARARSTKQKAHIARYEKLRDTAAPVQDETVELSSVSSRLGKTTVELAHISKSYQERTLIKDFSYIFLKNDRIGIIGPNGCGKTTLMKIIQGIVLPDSGTITIGQTVKLGYFSQECESLDASMRVIDYIKEKAQIIQTPTGTVTASQMLEQFLFPSDKQYTLIGSLSGGERRRLYLLRVLMEAPNILFLDEPTNDLDIATLTVLENYLENFDGIVVTVSHDRYFLDRVVKRIFAFEEDGVISQYEGGYSDYLAAFEKKNGYADQKSPAQKKNKEETKPVNKESWKQPRPKKKLSYQEQKDYDSIEDTIAELETRIEDLDTQILKEASNYGKLRELTEEKEKLENELEEKMNRWMELEEIVASLQS